MSIEGIEFIAGGEDVAAEQRAILSGHTLPNIIAARLAQVEQGHSAATDDRTAYEAMLRHVGQRHLQPMRDRTHGNATATELRGAARAAERLAALCWAFADKAQRHAARLDAAEQFQQED